jgi:hypothetical protein
MLCDRDAVPFSVSIEALEHDSKGRLKVLNRYHLENYFLDENVLAGVFSIMEPEGSWLRNPEQIRTRLKDIARSMISYTAALIESANYRNLVGNLDIMPRGCHDKSADDLARLVKERADAERTRINAIIDDGSIESSVHSTVETLQRSLDDDTDLWKATIPGKQFFNRFASQTGIDSGRLKTLYLREAERREPNPFSDIVTIFEHFSRM